MDSIRPTLNETTDEPAPPRPQCSPYVNSKNVGILGIEVYTPSTYISQSELEEHSGVSKGRYTIGLGQEGMGLCGDREDVNSLALTVVHSLLEKYNISPEEVGRLEIGTETLTDKSKSTKTHLLPLFHPNTDIEGATIINACYGGTAALLNAFAWVESDGWDGRFAIVVAADIAVYEKGPARPTGGAGAVAVLVGRDAFLTFDPRERVAFAEHVWDFYKPDSSVEYPTVDGALSQVCYYRALDDCYMRFAAKMEKLHGKTLFNANAPDYFVFHSPYNKLVQKSYGRMFLLDAVRRHQSNMTEEEKKNGNGGGDDPLREWESKELPETYADKQLEKVLKTVSAESFKKRLGDANYASQHVGNTYTASVFLGLASLIDRAGGRGDLTPGRSIVLFSYGSGALASMYRLTVRTPDQQRFTLLEAVKALSLTQRLSTRELVSPAELDLALDTRARMHHVGAPYTPVYPTSRLFPGTYYLTDISDKWVRSYERVPLDAKVVHGGSLAPAEVMALAEVDESKTSDGEERTKISCVITGVVAGLPGGRDNAVQFGEENLEKLIKGEQCIKPISDSTKQHLLEKNVVQIKKQKDGSIIKLPVTTPDDTISLAAQIGRVNLTTSYGVPSGLAETMDKAAQVAVAAGLEALRSAGLVKGGSQNLEDWKLPESLRDGTGVVYASSFPAMDAAVGEVMRFLKSKTVPSASTQTLLAALRTRVLEQNHTLTPEDETTFHRLATLSAATETSNNNYQFDRKFLFRVLVLGNAQLAQLAGCRGPNTQTNAACAGTTQAIAMAQDMLISRRAQRVVVIAGDNASGETLLPWLGSGFRALGATSNAENVEDAALPFDKRRNGILLGAGAIGMVLEVEEGMVERQGGKAEVKARLLATQYSNSAFHGANLCRDHIASELRRFLNSVEADYGISKEDIATRGVYLSHETGTHASPSQSCAANEVGALRDVLGNDLLSKMLILNTKGFTGHPMGVSFEDVAAVQVLAKQIVPPIVNYGVKDDYLGDLNLSHGGSYSCQYALRFAAGFGSQVAFALYATKSEK